MVNWYLGTIGFAYKAWRGRFYPPWLETRNYLATYSQIFNALELDTTFYSLPKPDRVLGWAGQLPDGFSISPKTPKTITHQFYLSQATADMSAFLGALRHFGERLGPVLLQWPPNFTFDETPELDAFLTALPVDIRYAVEFRHPSWYTPETKALLQKHRVAWVAVDYIHSPRQLTATTDFLYIRWLGDHGRFERGSDQHIDVTPQLTWWQQTLQTMQAASVDIKAIYGFFNDDYAGHAPETCNQFKELIGLPVRYPQFPRQGSLF